MRGQGKLRYLDGLRGVAALIVVLDHFWLTFFPASIDGISPTHNAGEMTIHNTPLNLFINGDLAVSIFFVLSGIVLSASYFNSHKLKSFVPSIVKRYIRLALPILGSVMLGYLLLRLGLYIKDEAYHITKSLWLTTLWPNPPQIENALWQGGLGTLLTDQREYNGVLWSMHFEFWGSMLIFALMALHRRLTHYRWALYAVAMIATFNTFFMCFVAGMAISDLMSRPYIWQRLGVVRRWSLPILLLGLLLGSYPTGATKGTLFEHLPTIYGAEQTMVAVHVWAAILIVAGVVASKRSQVVLSRRPILFLGRISFAMYLLHLLVLVSVSNRIFLSLLNSFTYKQAFGITLTSSLALIFSLSYLYARFVDEKAVRLSTTAYHQLLRVRLKPRTSPATQPAETPVIPATSTITI